MLTLNPWTTGTRWLNPQFFAAQIQIQIPNNFRVALKQIAMTEIIKGGDPEKK